jgi:hypothetical protein
VQQRKCYSGYEPFSTQPLLDMKVHLAPRPPLGRRMKIVSNKGEEKERQQRGCWLWSWEK